MPSIGLDMGGTKCLGVLLDDNGDVVREHRVPTPVGARAVVDALVEVAGELGAPSIGSVGVGVPGLVDRRGRLRYAPNLPGVAEIDIAGELRARLGEGCSVVVDNDATCAAWGEQQVGAGRDHRYVVMVTLGTGIGGGIVIGGELYRGAHGFAGEVGHMIVDPHGPRCPCGQRGCWERFASGSGLGRLGREAAMAGRAGARVVELAGGDPEDVKGEHVTQAAAEGDPAAARILADVAWWLALGLANLANAFDPEVFVLGGGLIEAGDVLLEPLRSAFAGLVEAVEHRPTIGIVPAALGERSGAIGAGLLARP